MTDTTSRTQVSNGLRDVAVALVDVAACIKDGDDIGTAMLSLRGAGSCLHLLEMTLLHIDQIEMRSQA